MYISLKLLIASPLQYRCRKGSIEEGYIKKDDGLDGNPSLLLYTMIVFPIYVDLSDCSALLDIDK